MFSCFSSEKLFLPQHPMHLVAQQTTSSFLTHFFNKLNRSRYPFIAKKEVDNPRDEIERAQKLHISCVTPIQIMHGGAMPAKANQHDNLPITQFWTIQKNELCTLRYSNDHDKVDIFFRCKHIPDDNNPRLLFDGNNTHNYSILAQVDQPNEKSKLYCFPTKGSRTENKEYDGELFAQPIINGCISALTVDDENNVLYCLNVCDSGNIPRNNVTKSYFYKAIIKEENKELIIENQTCSTSPFSAPLKKICPISKGNYLCLSEDNDLYVVELSAIHRKQVTHLKFRDIAVDPTNHNCAFLDTDGNLYTAPARALHTLEQIYTIDKLKNCFVERISYLAGICSIIYHTGHKDTLISGSCEQVKDSALVWQQHTKPSLIGLSLIFAAATLLYCKCLMK